MSAVMSVQPAPDAMAAERRHAVILCTELRGLAHVAEVLDPRVVLSLLSDFLNFAVEAIAAHDGEMFSAHHDTLLAAFGRGSPVQAAQAAVRAAQRIQNRFPAMAEVWRQGHGVRTAVAQGLHLGEVVFGTAGARGLERRVAFGDAVTLARSILARARAGEFIITDAVMGALSVENLDLDAEPLPPFQIGRRHPIRIYGVVLSARLDFT